MTSHRRMLSILDLYSPPGHPALTADQIMEALGYTRGTAYRYIKELVEAGLLSRIGTAYTLGPRIIELDNYIRQFDPVLNAGYAHLARLRDKFECDLLLASLFSKRLVVSLHMKGSEHLHTSYSRGHAMPLFRGAGGKVVLAGMPARIQKKLFETHKAEIAEAGWAKTWEQFRQVLGEVRRMGYAYSIGELDKGYAGIAIAVTHDGLAPPSCVVLLFSETRWEILDKGVLARDVIALAQDIQSSLASMTRSAPDVVADRKVA
jgi:DNA-binding IclR family transcriptional regulator